MSSIVPSPLGPATTTKRGSMSAADKTKLDSVTGTNTGDVTVSSPAGWLSLVGQALTFSLVTASDTVAGVVSLGAQTFAGVKTFASEVAASAGVLTTFVRAAGASLVLRSSLGADAADKCVVAGSSEADGTVHASAKVWVAATGIGGQQVDKAWVDKAGDIHTGGTAGVGGWFRGQSASAGRLIVDDSGGSILRYANCEFGVTGNGWNFFNHALAGIAFLRESGRFDQWGTDSSASPGATTINKPTGKSAIAAGASSVVITNSLVTTASRITITPQTRDATCKEIVADPGFGIITVSGNANATAAIVFSWQVSNII